MEEPLRNASNIHHDPKIIIKSISAGGHHSMLLTGSSNFKELANGNLYTFGYSVHGQLGLRTTVNQCLPRLVTDFTSVRVIKIAAGWHHSLVLTEKGDIYAAGHGAYGQLGLGKDESMPIFTHISVLGPKNIKEIYAGGDHSWVVLDELNPDKSQYSSPSPLRETASPIPTRVKDDDDELLLKIGKDVSMSANCIC